MSALSAYLRELVKQSGRGQNEFAELAGVVPGTFSKWLNGTHAPGLDQLVTLVDQLQVNAGIRVPLDTLIGHRIGREIVRSSGVDGRARRIADCLATIPAFAAYAEGFLDLSPADQDAVLTYVEMLHQASRRRQSGGQ